MGQAKHKRTMNVFTMTYEGALAVVKACLNGAVIEHLKGALQVAQRALRTEIGRGRRFDTDLESAGFDYVRDIAYDQGLEGENADDFFGKVIANGFDLMEAFHDGAEWQHDRDAGDDRWVDFDHVKELLRLVQESHMHGGESDEVLAELDQQVRDAWNTKKE